MTWQDDLGRKFGQAVAGQGVPALPTPGLGLMPNIERFITLTGSGRKAAAALGVPESTFRGWRHGTTPRHMDTRMGQIVQNARQRALGSRPTRVPGELAIKGTFRYSSDQRKRTIHPGRQVPAWVMQGLIRQWEQGASDATMGKAIARVVDAYYQPLKYVSVDEVSFE